MLLAFLSYNILNLAYFLLHVFSGQDDAGVAANRLHVLEQNHSFEILKHIASSMRSLNQYLFCQRVLITNIEEFLSSKR